MLTPPCRRAALLWLAVCAAVASGTLADAQPLANQPPADLPPADPPVVAIETTGEEIVGRLLSLDSDGDLRLAEGDGPRLKSGDVLNVVFEGAGRPAINRPALERPALGEVELVDGSRFAYVDVGFVDQSIQFELRDGVSLATRVTEIAWWRIGRGEGIERATTGGASDVLVVKRRDGSFAPVEGVVVAVSAEGVRFALDADDGAEPVDADWSRIGGLRFYRTLTRSSDTPGVILTLTDGSRVVVQEVRYANGQAVWSDGSASADAIASLDLSAGRVLAIRDLPLADAQWTPYFAIDGKDLAEGKGYAFNRSLLGGPLALRYPDRRAPGAWPAVSVERTSSHGVALRSRGELRFDLPDGSRRVRGWIGLDPGATLAGAAEVKILTNDATLWSGVIDGQTAPVALDAPIDGAATLTLQVDYGDNLDAGDFVNFCDLRVIR